MFTVEVGSKLESAVMLVGESSTEAQLVCGTQVLMVVLGDAVSGWVLV